MYVMYVYVCMHQHTMVPFYVVTLTTVHLPYTTMISEIKLYIIVCNNYNCNILMGPAFLLPMGGLITEVCIYIYIYMYIYIYICVCVCVSVCLCVYVFVHVCVCVCVYTCNCVYNICMDIIIV